MRSYNTLRGIAQFEYSEKRSRFIACATPVTSEREANDFLNQIRKNHPDARHTAYAYSIFDGDNFSQKFSDDGEPQGTAGMPMMDILQKKGITNAAVTVTRYFGGILLGAPGLLRAYTAAASGAVSDAGTVTVSVCRRVSIVVEYSFFGKIEKLYLSYKINAHTPLFSEKISIEYDVLEEDCDAFIKALTDATAGRIVIKLSEPYYLRMDQ